MLGKKPEKAGTPLWMTTMSDMNTLLMTFFILLFSLQVKDEARYKKIEGILREMGRAVNARQEGPQSDLPFLHPFPHGTESGQEEVLASREEFPRPRDLDFRVTKRAGRLIVHLGGEHGFAPGEYGLSDVQKRILDWIKTFMTGRRQSVVVRGFTDADPLDAFVLDGARLRPAKAGDAAPDHFLLSGLRAQEVRRHLASGRDAMDERQVRVGEFGAQRVEQDPKKAALNRRVEIMISSRVFSPNR